MGYRQLTQTQRYQIHARHDLGMGQRLIARELGIHSSTVSRELCRNASSSCYDPEQAQSLSNHRRRTAWKWTKRLLSLMDAVAGRLRGDRSDLLLRSLLLQRGSNENTSGLIQQYFPKGTDFRQVTDTELRKVVKKLNDRPRKRLGYRTPAQVFLGKYSGALDTAGAALIA